MQLFDHAADNPDRTYENRDNWLVAKEKYQFAMDRADELDERGIKLKTTESLFFKEYSHSQINYAEAISTATQDQLNEADQLATRLAREQGISDPVERSEFIAKQVAAASNSWGQKCQAAWKQADADFQEFSNTRKFLTPNKRIIVVGQQEQLQTASLKAQETIKSLIPGGYEALYQEKIAALNSPELTAIIRKPKEDRTEEERQKFYEIESKIQVGWQELADRVTTDADRTKAKQLANEISTLAEQIREIDFLRDPLNYVYWRTLIAAELTEANRQAHQNIALAKYHFSRGRNLEAAQEYQRAFCAWREVLNKFPYLRNDSVTADDLFEDIKQYRKIIATELPADFVLRDIVLIMEQNAVAETVPFPGLCGEISFDEKATAEKTLPDQSAVEKSPATPEKSTGEKPAPPNEQ
jgi:hypothetical protein